MALWLYCSSVSNSLFLWPHNFKATRLSTSKRRRAPQAPSRHPARSLLALDVKLEFLVVLRRRQQLVAGLLGKRLKILHRTGVGGDDAKHLAGSHLGQRLLGAQDGQRTVQAAGIEF